MTVPELAPPSLSESASCNGCCCRRSTTSFQSSRSCLTRSSCDSMCCCEICSRRSTEWSTFFAIISRMFRNRCEQRWRQALSTRKDMFSAQSSQPRSSMSASVASAPSASSKRGPGKTPTTCANFTTPFVSDAVQCFKSSNGFSFTFVSSTSCTASICAFQFCSSWLRCFSIFRSISALFCSSTSWLALFTVSPLTSSRSFRISRLLAKAALHPGHAQIKRTETPRRLRRSKLGLLFHRRDLLEGFRLLLAKLVLEAGLRVGHVALEIRPHHCNLVEAVRQRILRRVQGLLRRSQVLVREVDAPIQSVHRLVRVRRNLRFALLEVRFNRSDVVPNRCQDLVHLSPPRVHVQPKRRHHVANGLDRRIQIVVRLLPRDVVHLRVEFGVHLVLEIDQVLRQVLFLLLHLLERVRHVLHPRVVVLQGLPDVANVEPHRRNLRRHRRLHTLARSDDGVGRIHTCPHLVQVHVHSIHRRGEVLHVALARQDDPANVVDLALVVVQQVLQLADVVLERIQVFHDGLDPRHGRRRVHTFHPAGAAIQMRELLIEVRLHVRQLCRNLCFEVL